MDLRSTESEIYFVIWRGNDYVHIHEIKLGETVIGRGRSCDLILPDLSVSRIHASLKYKGTEIQICDLNSRNGVRLEGRQVSDAVVLPGALLEIGPYELMSYRGCCDALRAAGASGGSTGNETGDPKRVRIDKQQLTPTQRRVYKGFLEGCSEKEIAKFMGLSVHTVHGHAKEIYKIMSVSSRGELLAQLTRHRCPD